MATMPWLKLYTEIRTDPKMLALTDTEFRVWISMLCLAAESKDRGVISIAPGIAYPADALARALFVDTNSLKDALAQFQALRMVDVDDVGIITIVHFDDRQYDKPSDRPEAIKGRVQKHRARKAAEVEPSQEQMATEPEGVTPYDGNADETRAKHPSNATDVDRDSESDIDEESVPPNPPLPGGSQSPGLPTSPITPRPRNRKERRRAKVDGPPKISYAEYVQMTEAEYQSLVAEHGISDTLRMIEVLDDYKGAHGKHYASDYRAILTWVVERVREERSKSQVEKVTPMDSRRKAVGQHQRQIEDRRKLYDDVYET